MLINSEIRLTGSLEKEFIDHSLRDGAKQALIIDANDNKLIRKSNGTFNYPVLKERILSDHWSFVFEKPNHFMFDAFDRKSVQLFESGIASKIIRDFTKFKKVIVSNDAQQLTMAHLEIWFQIWFYFICAATICFIFEVLCFKLSKFFSRLIAEELDQMKLIFSNLNH
jgi:hypothetical protein